MAEDALGDGLKIDRCDYTCGDCSRSYHTERGLERHRERIHGGGD